MPASVSICIYATVNMFMCLVHVPDGSVCLCIKVLFIALDAFSVWVLCAISNLKSTLCDLICCSVWCIDSLGSDHFVDFCMT